MRDKITTILASGFGISSIEFLDRIHITDFLKFSGETIIGILTIIYLILKIKKLYNEKKIFPN
jgi:hypothetical protein